MSIGFAMDENPGGKSDEDDLIEKYRGKISDRSGWMGLIQKAVKDGNDKLADFLWRLLGPPPAGAAEDDELDLAGGGAMDSRGRRIVKPASAADHALFAMAHGIPRRRIRNLGTGE